MEMEKLAIEANGGPIKRPSDGKEVKKVTFVQCAGQRSDKEGHLNYCSGDCCLTSIKQAMYFKDQNPEIETEILFDDLRTPGAPGEDFYRSGQEKMVTFRKGKVSEVVAGSNGPLVKFKDLILDEDLEEEAAREREAEDVGLDRGHEHLVRDLHVLERGVLVLRVEALEAGRVRVVSGPSWTTISEAFTAIVQDPCGEAGREPGHPRRRSRAA